MKPTRRGIVRANAVVLILIAFVGIFAVSFYFLYSQGNEGVTSPQDSPLKPPNPAPSNSANDQETPTPFSATIPESTIEPSPKPSEAPTGDSFEPDNVWTQSGTATINQSETTVQYRTIFPKDDVDYIRFQLEAGRIYYFDILDLSGGYASLHNSDYQSLVSGNSTNDDLPSINLDYHVRESGVYYLVVGANNPESANGDYRLWCYCSLYATLDEAITQGLADVSLMSEGLQSMGLWVESSSNLSLRINVTAGTKFQSQSPEIQSMVALFNKMIYLSPFERDGFYVQVACLNMRLKIPGNRDEFTVSQGIPDDLSRLLRVSTLESESVRVQQFAVWTITDNPARGEYSQIGTTSNFSGPSNAEMQSVQNLFQTANIDLTKYRAFGSHASSPTPYPSASHVTAPPSNPTPTPTSSPVPTFVLETNATTTRIGTGTTINLTGILSLRYVTDSVMVQYSFNASGFVYENTGLIINGAYREVFGLPYSGKAPSFNQVGTWQVRLYWHGNSDTNYAPLTSNVVTITVTAR